VRLYRIVAPTEWNFHPQGALATALVGAPAGDAAAARLAALRLVNSLDPCVNCSVEVTDA
jgi:Ni,Fe-hydrogenase I large subunit